MERLVELTDGAGADVAFEYAGVDAVLAQAVASVRDDLVAGGFRELIDHQEATSGSWCTLIGQDDTVAVELPELLLPDAASWREWLAEHNATSPGVRLVLHKTGGAVTALTSVQALDEALCVGWIDGQLGGRDEGSFRRRFTPRRPRSPWSVRNTEHVARLVAAGRMTPPGQAAVDAAKADGRWEAAYAGSANITVPEDLALAVAAGPAVQATWDELSSTNRYAFLWRLTQVKRTETRARKIARFVAMLGRGETFHPQKARPPLD